MGSFPQRVVATPKFEQLEHRPINWLNADPDYWAHRADDCRRVLREIDNADVRRVVYRLVADHQRMTELADAERRERLVRESEQVQRRLDAFIHQRNDDRR